MQENNITHYSSDSETVYLESLKEIKLSYSNLTSIPDYIFQIENLSVLHLNNNNITHLSASIGKLKNLRVLNLSQNRIKELPPEIGQLNSLRYLNLEGNELESLPKEIRHLQSLKKLDLGYNKFNKFPKVIRQLINLRFLKINNGKFRELPTGISNLHKLKTLDLRSCGLGIIPHEIGKIKTLEVLLLSRNYLQSIPIEVKNLKALKHLDLDENSFLIPPEILNDRPEIILDFYFSSLKGFRSLNEVKLLLVGQGSVGKTSLVERILTGAFNTDQPKTEGISISSWQVRGNTQDSLIKVNMWDFGGQEIMHATHQFFLTKRSLYLLVLDSRLTQEENRVEYWLKVIQSFGGDSPVLIVGNKTDQHPLDINRTGLRDKYQNIVGIIETSAATGAGLESLKEIITDKINQLPHVHDMLPEAWFAVKSDLENLGRRFNFITIDQYKGLCVENKIKSEINQQTIIRFMNDLGVVLCFQDDPRLESLGILNPQWVTNGVYKILNSHALFRNKGVLSVNMLNRTLNSPEYPHDKRLFIVDMMKKFELCYDIESDKTFLVPDLLPKDEPADLKFNGVPAFEYAYPVLPSSVITRFIVRMNQKIDDGFVWRTGVVLKIGDNKALVKADIEDRKITIAIDGQEHTRRETLTAIFYHLNDIHESIKGLNPEKLVPVPGAKNAKPIPYNYLLMLEAKGIEILPVPDGNRLIDVNVRKVLSGVPNEVKPKESAGSVTTTIFVGGNFDGNLTVGDSNQSIKDSYNKVTTASIDPELKQTLQQLVAAVETMNQSLPAEQSAETTEDLGKLVEEATKSKPNQKWYSVSIEGLIKAAENLDQLGTPVISLSRKVLSLLTGGVVK